MNLEQKLQRTSELMRLWGDAERLCNTLCHKLDWVSDGDTVQQLNCTLARARTRAARRYQRYRSWYLHEL